MSNRLPDLPPESEEPANHTVTLPRDLRRHPVVSREAWIKARLLLLKDEKALTRERDRIHAKRRELPWVRVEKAYVFDGPQGRLTLADLFGGRSQLIVQHFMLGPGWPEGCVGCSFQADHIAGARVHLENHDVSIAAISRAPWPEIAKFKTRMGWDFPWVSSYHSEFNFDYHVSFTREDRARGSVYYNYEWIPYEIDELGATSVFYKDEYGVVYHTYSAYGRGDEQLINTYNYLDLTPKGRNENGPSYNLMDWARHHDRYQNAPSTGQSSCGHHSSQEDPD